jgi:hypothetical protein
MILLDYYEIGGGGRWEIRLWYCTIPLYHALYHRPPYIIRAALQRADSRLSQKIKDQVTNPIFGGYQRVCFKELKF